MRSESSRATSTWSSAASWISALRSCPSFGKPGLDIPVFELPKDAQIFATERWERAPVMAAVRAASGAVLWIAAPPGQGRIRALSISLAGAIDLGVAAALPQPTAVGILRRRLSLARRSGLLRRPVAQGRNWRAARGRLALLRIESPRATLFAAPDRGLPPPRDLWFTCGSSCRTSARSFGWIIRNGAKKPPSFKTRSWTGASS